MTLTMPQGEVITHAATLDDARRAAIAQRVQQAAESIYGPDWNYYSNALRDDVTPVFEASCLAAARDGALDFLEIGSAQGLSMAFIGLLLDAMQRPGARVSLDPYFEGGYTEGLHGPPKEERKVTIDAATRERALGLWSSLGLLVEQVRTLSQPGMCAMLGAGRRFDLIYIDGSHERLAPLIDFGLATQLLRPGGVVMLDDPHWKDVHAVKSLCDEHAEPVAECWKVAAYRLTR